jgi:hypothetical protein
MDRTIMDRDSRDIQFHISHFLMKNTSFVFISCLEHNRISELYQKIKNFEQLALVGGELKKIFSFSLKI